MSESNKSKEDEKYERGVKDGQKGNFLEDLAEYISRDSDSSHSKGYKYGAEHRYNDEGQRYHAVDGSGANDEPNSSNSQGSGGCYLTTACVAARGLPDNCLELRTLRWFRDGVLLKTPSGRTAVKEYYRIAPRIVEEISLRPDSTKIWDAVYSDVRVATAYVLAGDYNSAFQHYRTMVQKFS